MGDYFVSGEKKCNKLDIHKALLEVLSDVVCETRYPLTVTKINITKIIKKLQKIHREV